MRKRQCSESEAQKNCFNTLIEQQPVEDITIGFFYKPHTLTLLIGVICGLLYVALIRSGTTWQEDFFHGFIAVCIIFLFLCTLFMPNGPFTRPHPVIWRIIFGLSLIYFLLLVATLFLKLDHARQLVHWVFPKLINMTHGDILDKEYAVNCSQITWKRFYSHIDSFALAHFLGWMVKACLLRHYLITWTLSINWEITEIAFCHMMPNFCECWWDSLILDVVLCNGLGIFVGMKLVQWLEMRNFHWESIRHITSTSGKIKRAALQFTPSSWTLTRWFDSDSSFQRGFMLSVLAIIWQFAELNSFFLKYIFIVYPSHPITLYRLALITLMSAPGIRQYYLYVTNSNVQRVGSQLWLFLAVILTELIICLKFGREILEKAVLHYFVCWIAWLIVSSFGMVYFCIFLANRNRSKLKNAGDQSPAFIRKDTPANGTTRNGGSLKSDCSTQSDDNLGSTRRRTKASSAASK